MIAFEVFANDLRVCTAGLEGRHVLTVIVQSVPRTLRPGDRLSEQELQLMIGGLAADKGTHHRWIDDHALAIGDEIRIRVPDVAAVDPPVQD